MAYKKYFKKKKKYSLRDRLSYHNKRWDFVASRQKDSASIFKLFAKPKIAYSVGFTDGVNETVNFDNIRKHGGNEKMYAKGVIAGRSALEKSKTVKF